MPDRLRGLIVSKCQTYTETRSRWPTEPAGPASAAGERGAAHWVVFFAAATPAWTLFA